MSDETTKPGPTMPDSVTEVQGIFPSDKTMQDAIAKLTLAGFDRADFSLPITNPTTRQATPSEGAENPTTDTDVRQLRTMGTGMAGYAGAFAAAGATIATGGAAAVAIAAAAAVGAGAALAANAVGNAADDAQSADRDALAAKGELVLAVHANTPSKREAADRILKECGATKTQAIERAGETGVDASSWTG